MPGPTAAAASRPRGYRCGELEIDLGSHRLTRAGRPLAIEPRVFDALVYLIERRARLVTKQELFEGVWGEEFVSDNALSRTIARLRRLLDDDTRRPRFIETVHGRGYRFVAEVEPLPGAAGEAPAAARPARPGGRRRLAVRAVAAAALAAAAMVAAWWTLDPRPAAEQTAALPTGAAAALDPLRVAVLPLRDLGEEEESRYFAEGLTEQMVSVLSRIDGLRIISATTTLTYRDARRRISEIAGELGAGTMLAGSVRRGGDELRVTVELIDAANEELLWSREFDTRPEDVFAVQSEVATRVADALQLSLPLSAVRRIREGPTREMTAYDHYLRGRQAYRETTRSGNETAIQHYRRALEADPQFALARAGLANAYAVRSIRFGFGNDQRQLAEQIARAALAADPELPEAYKALGIVALNRGQLRQALDYNRRALELNPSYDEAIYNAASASALTGAWDEALRYQLRATTWVTGRAGLAAYLLRLGFRDEGERLAAAVLEEQPLARYLNLNLAEHEWFRGEIDSARRRIARVTAAEPTWPRGHRMAGDLELWQGELVRAAEHYRRALEAAEGDYDEAVLRLAFIDRAAGRHEEAARRLAAIDDRLRPGAEAGSESWKDYWLLASVAALRSDLDGAIAWHAAAVRTGWREHWRDASDPGLAALRGDPRFAAQLDEMRRQVEAMRERVRGEVARALPRILRPTG